MSFEERKVEIEEEEEEEEEDVPVRRGGGGGFRLIQQENAAEPQVVPVSPTPMSQHSGGEAPKTPVSPHQPQQVQQQGQGQALSEEEALKRQQWIQQKQEMIKQKQMEAMQRAREEALKAHAEAKARAEAARQQQLQQMQQQQQSQQPQQQQSQQYQQQQQQQQQRVSQPQPASQMNRPQQAAPQSPASRGYGGGGAAPQTPKSPKAPQDFAAQQRQQPQQQQQQRQQQQPINRSAGASEAVAPSLGPFKPVLTRANIQPRPIGGMVNQYTPAQGPPPEEEQPLVAAPKHRLIGDEAWQQQKRVVPEVEPIRPERIQVADFLHESESRPTVIAPVVVESTKVKWNEFPEEPVFERQQVPKVKAQEWEPQNEVEHPVHKTTYAPGRIQRQWPPHEAEAETEMGKVTRTKTQADEGWITNPSGGVLAAEAEQNGDVGNAPWKSQVGREDIRSREWPPPQYVWEAEPLQRSRLGVQWPPPEQEAHEQQSVEVLQTHLPVKQHNRQWPPPEPEYQMVPRRSAVLEHRVGAPSESTPATPTTKQQMQQRGVQFAPSGGSGNGGAVKSPPAPPPKSPKSPKSPGGGGFGGGGIMKSGAGGGRTPPPAPPPKQQQMRGGVPVR